MNKVMTLMNELIELISMGPFGSDIKVDNFVNDGVPVLNGSNVSSIKLLESSFKYVTPEKAKALKKANAKRGDIVITHRGTVGQISYIPENSKYDNYVISQSQFRVSLKRDLIDPIYFTYYFHTEEGQKRLLSFKSHVGVPALAQATTNFRLLKFPLIPLIEQQKIAKFLSDLDAKIELNNKINMELEAMAKTLYNYWFVQFDFPDSNGKPYRSTGGKMVWNVELKREIPEGWEVKPISKVIEVKDGTHDSPKPKTTGYPLITSKNLKAEGLDFENANLISEEDYLSINKRSEVKTGDILFSMIGNIGTIYKVEEKKINFAIKNVALYKTSQNEDFKNYIYMFLKSIDMNRYMKNVISGSIQKFIGLSSLRNTPFLINESQINKYEIKTKSIFSQLENLKLENQELASLRDWLLPMLMSGQISVDAVEEQLGMVGEPVQIYEKIEKKNIEKVKKAKTTAIKLNPVDVYKRTLLAAEIVFQLKDTYTLGHLKLQKLLFLCQEIENVALPMNFLKQAMGPYDSQLARSLDKQFVEKKWFEYQKEASLKFKPLENCGKHRGDFNKYFEDQLEGINYLIKKFTIFTSTQIEAVATLYACWKEAIENKELINDKLIITKFYNWSREKEKFKEENLVKALAWMRKNGIEPKTKLNE